MDDALAAAAGLVGARERDEAELALAGHGKSLAELALKTQ
jgi:hypothetical protein